MSKVGKWEYTTLLYHRSINKSMYLLYKNHELWFMDGFHD